MFLIRTAFWLTLIILLLPANDQEQEKMYGTASAAVKDLKSFCVRNPDVCVKSAGLFRDFTQKAEFGAKLVMDFVKDVSGDGQTEPADRDAKRRPSRETQGTLRPDDMGPGWFGGRKGSDL